MYHTLNATKSSLWHYSTAIHAISSVHHASCTEVQTLPHHRKEKNLEKWANRGTLLKVKKALINRLIHIGILKKVFGPL